MDAITKVAYKFVFSDNNLSSEPNTYELTRVEIEPAHSQISKIEMAYDESDGCLFGFKLYD